MMGITKLGNIRVFVESRRNFGPFYLTRGGGFAFTMDEELF